MQTHLLNTLQYVFGGTLNDKEACTNEVYVFDTETEVWNIIPVGDVRPSARMRYSCSAYATGFIVFAGVNPNSIPLPDMWAFDTRTRKWKKLMSLDVDAPCPRYHHASCVVGDCLYIFGGTDPDNSEQGIFSDLHIFRLPPEMKGKVSTRTRTPSESFEVDKSSPSKKGKKSKAAKKKTAKDKQQRAIQNGGSRLFRTNGSCESKVCDDSDVGGATEAASTNNGRVETLASSRGKSGLLSPLPWQFRLDAGRSDDVIVSDEVKQLCFSLQRELVALGDKGRKGTHFDMGGGDPESAEGKFPSASCVKLNVGGYRFQTSIRTLTSTTSRLAAFFRQPDWRDSCKSGEVLIDRDGSLFRLILNFLRDGNIVVPELEKERHLLLLEAAYYGLDDLVELLQR